MMKKRDHDVKNLFNYYLFIQFTKSVLSKYHDQKSFYLYVLQSDYDAPQQISKK